MKKVVFSLIMVLGIFVISSEVSADSLKPNALGLRLGGGVIGGGAELSYQKVLGSANRLEFDLGWAGGDGHSWFALAGIYHWYWNITGGLNWFVGPGAQVGFWSHDDNSSSNDDDSGITLGVGGQIGIEYDFNTHGVPIQLGLDARPMFGFIKNSGFGWDGALSIRYTF